MTSQVSEAAGSQAVTSEGKHSTVRAGIVLGLGLGGFVDGIVFHQLLQWHHMVTSAGYPPTSVENLQVNTLADGLFHAGTWIVTLVGILMLWQAARAGANVSSVVLIGAMLVGFGAFNLVEGLVNHFILQIHHVREDVAPNQQVIYDAAFLAWGAVMVVIGWLMTRRER